MKQRPTDIENKLMWRTGVDEIRNKIKLDNTRYHHVQREQGRQQPGCSNDAVFETEGGARILVHPTPAHPFPSPYTSLVSATAITEDERREGLGKPRLVLCDGSHQHACAGRNQPLAPGGTAPPRDTFQTLSTASCFVLEIEGGRVQRALPEHVLKEPNTFPHTPGNYGHFKNYLRWEATSWLSERLLLPKKPNCFKDPSNE